MNILFIAKILKIVKLKGVEFIKKNKMFFYILSHPHFSVCMRGLNCI